jgi:hypothetical protein
MKRTRSKKSRVTVPLNKKQRQWLKQCKCCTTEKKNYEFNMLIEKELMKRKQYKKDVRHLRKEETGLKGKRD